MRALAWVACGMAQRIFIPLFAKKPSHSSVPLERKSASARSEGQGRPKAGAWREPLTAASTLAGWRRSGDKCRARRALVLILAGMLAFAAPMTSLAQPQSGVRQTISDPYAGFITEAAQRFGIPQAWIRAVMRAESAADPRAVSTKGAMGLMQIMPATWGDLRARLSLGRDPFDPHDNILAGAAYLRMLHDRYGSPGFLAAYNAGPARYEASLTGRSLPGETRAYVASLTPVINSGDTTGPVMIATAGPPRWTAAPLFVVQPTNAAAADLASASEPKSDTPRVTSTTADTPSGLRDLSGIVPTSGDLFVNRMNAGALP